MEGFGFDFESVKSEDQLIASTYRRLFHPNGTARLTILVRYLVPFFKFLPLASNISLDKDRNTIRDTALSMIRLKQEQNRDKEGRGERDIVGVMIEENRRNRENGLPHDALTEDEMVNQIMTFLAAGFSQVEIVADVAMRRHLRPLLGHCTCYLFIPTFKNDSGRKYRRWIWIIHLLLNNWSH